MVQDGTLTDTYHAGHVRVNSSTFVFCCGKETPHESDQLSPSITPIKNQVCLVATNKVKKERPFNAALRCFPSTIEPYYFILYGSTVFVVLEIVYDRINFGELGACAHGREQS